MMRHAARTWGLVSIVTALMAVGASAQDLPWDSFEDLLTGEVCDVINAGPDKLVVLLDGSTLAIVSGPDRVLDDSFVDVDGEVFFEGLDESLGGSIVFDYDGFGNLGLWWIASTGTVMEIDDFTGDLLITDLLPSDYLDSLCDACPLWDDQSVCDFDPVDPPDGPDVIIDSPEITIEICGSGIPISIGMIFSSLMFLRFSRRRSY